MEIKKLILSLLLLIYSIFSQSRAQYPFDVWAEGSEIPKIFFDSKDVFVPSTDFDVLILPRLDPSTPDSIIDYFRTFYTMFLDSANISTFSYGNGLDFFYWMGAWDATTAKINWCGDTNNITLVGTPVFTQYQGWLTSNVNYINTNFKPLSEGVSYTQNNACILLYSRTNSSAAGWDIGCDDGSANGVTLALNWGGNGYARINCTQKSLGAVANSLGLVGANRYSANSNEYLKNGVSTGTSTTASATLKDLNIYIGGINNAGSFGYFTARQYLCAFAGKSFTITEQRGIFNCIEWLADKLEVGVVS